jgi:formyltetrahydrofolate hydrolase
MKNTAILLVQCPDRKGLDATIAEFIYRYDGNILHSSSTRPAKIAFTWRASSGTSMASAWTCAISMEHLARSRTSSA